MNIPPWVDPEAWAGFVEARKAMGRTRPFTDRAAQLIIKRLEQFKALGHDPNASLDQSTMNGWQGVFPPKQEFIPRVTTAVDETQAYLAKQAAIRPSAELARAARLRVVGK